MLVIPVDSKELHYQSRCLVMLMVMDQVDFQKALLLEPSPGFIDADDSRGHLENFIIGLSLHC